MKCNAHLYLPWSVIAELVASADSQSSKVKSDPLGLPVASVESLDVLYRLLPGRDERDRRKEHPRCFFPLVVGAGDVSGR